MKPLTPRTKSTIVFLIVTALLLIFVRHPHLAQLGSSAGIQLPDGATEQTPICEKDQNGQFSDNCTTNEMLASLPPECNGQPSLSFIHEGLPGDNLKDALQKLLEFAYTDRPQCILLQSNYLSEQ